jgi:hypothetical protein
VERGARAEELTPLAIPIPILDDIAKINGKPGVGGVGDGSPDQASPMGLDAMLDVAKEEKLERFAGGGSRCAELMPRTPSPAVTDPVNVLCIRLEVGKRRGVVVGLAQVGHNFFGGGSNPPGSINEPRTLAERRDFCPALSDGGVGPPSD